MKKVVTGAVMAFAVMNSDVAAQSCVGVNSCSVTANASVTVPALLSLSLGSGTIPLTAPTDLNLGSYVQDNGPTFTVKANRSWSLSVHTTAASNWTYTGTNGGVKPIADLTWSNTAGGTYAAITNSAAAIVSGQARTNAGSPTIFFRTLYAAAYDDPRNAAGTFEIPLVFTVSAP